MSKIIQSAEKEKSIQILRASIIKSISETPSKKYLLLKLLWGDAAKCFTDAPFAWDCAEFYLNLESGRLFAETSTYPNQFGACREHTYFLTPEEFHQKVAEHGMGELLLNFESREDWDKLFDDELKDAVSAAAAKIREKEAEREEEKRRENSIKIPDELLNTSPAMNLSTIKLKLSQLYAANDITVTIKNGKYFIEYYHNSHLSSNADHYSRELSTVESVWLEKTVESTLSDKDMSTWHSLPGGDTMDISIIGDCTEKNVYKTSVEPITKYSYLMNNLKNLAQYGSIIVTSES